MHSFPPSRSPWLRALLCTWRLAGANSPLPGVGRDPVVRSFVGRDVCGAGVQSSLGRGLVGNLGVPVERFCVPFQLVFMCTLTGDLFIGIAFRRLHGYLRLTSS